MASVNSSSIGRKSLSPSWIVPVPVAATDRKAGHDSTDKLIIAVDFGTTYTGIAYGLTSDPSVITVITEWPGTVVQGRNDTVKIPSIIKYGISKDGLEPSGFDWGYKVGVKDTGVIRGIKLALDPDKRGFYNSAAGLDAGEDIIHLHEETTTAELVRLSKTTVDIIADYLGAVYKHALSKIREREYSSYIDSLTKEFVLTVPAIWSDRAKNATLIAARNAHKDMLVNPENLITEPEAAALFAFQAFSKRGLSNGDAFVLCDAGGGTVDLISYQVGSVHPKLQLRELVSASGAAVGSMMINNGFERYLREILDKEHFNGLKAGDGIAFNSIINDFEFKIKPNFSSAKQWDELDMNNTISFPGISVPDDLGNNIRENTLTVKGDVLDRIFNPLVTATETLIQAQLDEIRVKLGGRSAKIVFLVGGFGASPYLKRRIQALVDPIQVIQPADAWSAIVRGAVMSKMPRTVRVTSTIAPQNLGVRAKVPYKPLEHPEEAAAYKVIDPYEGIERISKMTWYILKDTELNRDRKVRFSFYRDIPFDYKPEDLKFVDNLEASDAVIPPTYPWEGVSQKCTLSYDLSGLLKDQLTERTKEDGTKYYSVEYELVTTVLAALMVFSVECNGVEYGSVEVDY